MDSQRSWLAAAGCCWINIFSFFMIRSVAVVYVNVIDTFHTTREQASWPVTLAVTCFFSAALIAGILVRYVPVWKITFTASIVAGAAVSSCYFATGVTYLCLLYGVVYGLGVGHLTLSSTVIYQHFSKYRAVASGINMAGYSIGGLVFPPTTQFFFDEYGFRGAFLLSGGTMLNATAGTLLQRIPPPVQSATILSKAAQTCEERDVIGNGMVAARDRPEETSVPGCSKDSDITHSKSMYTCRTNDGETPSSSWAADSQYRGYYDAPGVINEGFEPAAHEDRTVMEMQLPALSYKIGSGSLREAHSTHKTRRRASSAAEAALPIQNVLHTEHACSKREFQTSVRCMSSTTDEITSVSERQLSRCERSQTCARVSVAQTARRKPPGSKSGRQALKELFSFLTIPKYYSVLLSYVVIVTNSSMFTTIIIDFAVDCGIDRWRALNLIITNTALDLMARLSMGWVTDRELISRSTLMSFCLTVWTVADFCLAFFHSYSVLVAVSAVAGWCNGSMLPMIPVLYMEIMDIGHFSVAYGLTSFTAGLIGLTKPPLTGKYCSN
ncbi:hypothetical protein HPB48_007462 [Haemaphysalis longicornis]|uniref:Monocarboxylate transporter n=1 Tax=Haemaphysalis longicornis TaxID=44386 RepID=A0A9J6GH26_HAELO|nr:hypothetical protein HPB48_007462 [Haemaphysalis longicornis]